MKTLPSGLQSILFVNEWAILYGDTDRIRYVTHASYRGTRYCLEVHPNGLMRNVNQGRKDLYARLMEPKFHPDVWVAIRFMPANPNSGVEELKDRAVDWAEGFILTPLERLTSLG